jgi:hypothetical protein
MRRHLLCLLLMICVVPAASAQPQQGCIGQQGVPTDSLYAQARRLHPAIARPENRSNTVVVALVFDNRCAMVRHAMARVTWPGTIGKIMRAAFPDSSRLDVESFEISGFTAFAMDSAAEIARSPVIAWGILTPRGIRP